MAWGKRLLTSSFSALISRALLRWTSSSCFRRSSSLLFVVGSVLVAAESGELFELAKQHERKDL